MAERDRTVRDYIQPGTEERERMREDFDFSDSDHDGRISEQEFVGFMTVLDPQITAEECRIGFAEIDSDQDGAIEFDEFIRWWAED